jgi:predicted Zn-dependent protease
MQSRQQLAARFTQARPDLIHAIMVGRSRVLSNPGADGMRSYVVDAEGATGNPSQRARDVAILYAGALASSKLRDPVAAGKLADKLASLTSGDPAAARLTTLLMAEIALQAGDAARVTALLDGSDGGRPELLLASQARMRLGAAAEVAQRLQTWVALHPRDAEAWLLLSTAYSAQGQTLRSIRAEAEAQVAHMDYQAALDRFKAAQQVERKSKAGAADHIEASIIDTRARQVESLLREQRLER